MPRPRLAVLACCALTATGLGLVSAAAPGQAAASCPDGPPSGAVEAAFLGRYATDPAPNGSAETRAEIVAYEANRLYVMNIGRIDVVDVTNPADPQEVGSLPLPGEPTSVAVSGGLVAVSVPASPKTDPGRVLFFRDGKKVGDVTVGALPDMVAFTGDGALLAVANEAEPNSYGQADSVDPEGSVSVIVTQPFRTPAAGKKAQPTKAQPAETISFAGFNAGGPRHGELPGDLRLFGPGATVAEDLEPEYITIADDNRTAWVSLQENNALAKIDLKDRAVTAIHALGYSDHSQAGFGLDASDQGGVIDISTWPVRGLYMPDGITNFSAGGTRYVLTANEGDARDWPGISSNGEEARRARSVADLAKFPDADVNTKLGRLNVTPFAPGLTTNGAGKLQELYSYGSRSFSVRTADGALVWDSGDAFECLTADALPANFNASNSNNTLKNRSDDKGPEPESVVTGKVGDRQLAFVALERIGGVMVYDVSDPEAPTFERYLVTREFVGSTVGPDSGPEGMVFIPAAKSPTGQAILAVGHEVTGTVVFWELS